MPVELVFIHGWGFNAHLWDVVCESLPQFRQTRVDLGFFGKPKNTSLPQGDGKILIGHSLGFVHGLKRKQDWSGWIAVNSFPRFVATENRLGCTTATSLRDIRKRLQADPQQALKDFYSFIDAAPPEGEPDTKRLREGLDELRDADIGNILENLDVPGLVLAGREDPLVPVATSEELGRMARQGGIKFYNEAGHVLPQTAPDLCAEAIADFVTTCFDH